MEHDQGVYRSRIDTRQWEPDTDVGGVAHILFEEEGSIAGLWRSDPEHPPIPGDVEIPARETIVVLEGSVRVGLNGAPAIELSVGDIASLPKRARVCWDASPDCKVFWVYS